MSSSFRFRTLIMSELLVGPVNVQEQWANWKSTHSKNYESDEEEQRRFAIFENNIQQVLEHNQRFQSGEVTYSKGLNSFSDLTKEEVPRGLYQKR